MGNRPTRAASTGKGIGNNSTNPRRRSLLLNPPANTSAGNEAYITSPRSSESGGEESTQQRNTAIGTAPATAPATGTSDNAIEISDSDENGEETGGTAPGTSNDVIEISDSEDNGEEAERQMSSVAPVPESFPVSPRGEPTQDREEERASPERRETAPATQDLAQRTEAAAPATDWDEDAGEEALEAQNDDIDVSGALNLQGARTAAVYGRIEQNWQREREQGPPLEHRGAPLMTTEEPPLENITAAAAVAAAIDESQVEEAPADQNEDDTPGTRDSLINPPLSTMYDPGLFTGDGNYGADIQGDDGWEIYEGADMPPTEVPDEVPAGDPDGHPDNLQGQPNVFQNSVSEDLPNGLPNVDVNEIFHTNGLARNNGFTGENIPPYTYGRINNHTGYINGDETIHEPNDSGPNHIGSQHPMQDPRQERQQRPENEQHQNPDVMTNHYAPNEEEGTAQATAQPDPSQVENAAAEPRRGSHQFPIDLTGEPQEGLQQEQRDEERQESEVEDRTGLQFPNPHLNPNYPFSPDTNPGDSPETSSATSTINDSDPETHREHELGPEPATEPAPEPEPEPEQEQELEQAEEEERDIPEYQSLPRRQTGKRPRRSRNVQPSSSASRPRAPTKIRRRGRGNLQASGTVPPLRRSARLQALRESRNAQMSATSQPETSTEQQSQGRSGNRHASGAVSRARGSTGPGKRRGSGIARASGAVSRPKQKTRGGRQPQSGSEQQEENNDNQHEGRETTTSPPPRGIKRRSPSESGDEGPSKRRQTQVPTGNLRASGSAPQTEGKTKGGGQSSGQKKKKKASGRARKDDVSYKPEDEVEEDEEYEEGEEMQEPPSAKPRGIKRRSPSESENEGPSKPRQTQAPSGSSRTLGNDSQPRGKKGGCGQASGQKNKKKATGRAKKYDVAYKPGDEVDEDEEEEEMQGPPSALPRGIKRVSLSEPPHERPRKRPQTKAPAGSSQQAPGQKRADPQARSSRKRQKAAVKGNTRKKDAEYVDDQATSDVEDTLNLGGKTLSSIIINDPPAKKLSVFVFGANGQGQLGLGRNTQRVVREPTLHAALSKAGVVQLAAGAAHCVALTHDGTVFTWGNNEDGQLGRETWKTSWQDTGEAGDPKVPAEVNFSHLCGQDTKVAQVAATESATFVLTVTGTVIGWGTFREKCVKSGSDVEENTIIGFRPGIKIQHTPMLIPELNGIRALAAGAQHILAINVRKAVLTWGANNRGQLGRKVLPRQRDNTSNLIPRACTFPGGKWGHTDQFDVVTIGAGEYHSFAVRMDGEVYAWGCNMYGQTGIAERLLQEDSCIPLPRVVWTLPDQQTRSITGGTDHSVAVTQDGRCLSWASVANAALVIRREDLQNDITDHHDTVDSRMLRTPTLVTCIDGSVAHAVAGPSHTLVVTRKGKAFGWGSNSHFEVSFIDRSDVESPKLIQSEELERRRVVGAAAGKHFSILLTERLEEWSEHLPS